VVPTSLEKIGGALVHEYDHYLFFKEKIAAGAKLEELTDFYSKNELQIEKRAYEAQISFLQHFKSKVPEETIVHSIKVLYWSDNGFTIELERGYLQTVFTRTNVQNSIDPAISDLQNIITQIQAGKDSISSSQKNNLDKIRQITQLLTLQLKIYPKREDYPFKDFEV
jgi:hypothetical protein